MRWLHPIIQNQFITKANGHQVYVGMKYSQLFGQADDLGLFGVQHKAIHFAQALQKLDFPADWLGALRDAEVAQAHAEAAFGESRRCRYPR